MGIKIGFRIVSFDGDTRRSLVPATPMDASELQRFDCEATYTCEFTKMRNYEYHKRYFAMLQVLLDIIDDDVRRMKGITTVENLLLQLKLSLGHCDMLWLDEYQQVVMTPRSISFASMDEYEFREFYKRTLDVAIERYLPEGNKDAQSWRDMVNDAVMKLVGFF